MIRRFAVIFLQLYLLLSGTPSLDHQCSQQTGKLSITGSSSWNRVSPGTLAWSRQHCSAVTRFSLAAPRSWPVLVWSAELLMLVCSTLMTAGVAKSQAPGMTLAVRVHWVLLFCCIRL